MKNLLVNILFFLIFINNSLLKAELNIDVNSSWMIGDNDSDIEASTSIGCKAIKISNNFSLDNAVHKILNYNASLRMTGNGSP